MSEKWQYSNCKKNKKNSVLQVIVITGKNKKINYFLRFGKFLAFKNPNC